MRTFTQMISCLILIAVLGACAQADSPAVQAQVVEQHLKALTERDESRFTQTLCEAWTIDAFLEYDSLSTVQPRLENVSCSLVESTDATATVQCSGDIVGTYGNETQRFPLKDRKYSLVLQAGEWLVCGYKQ